MWLEKGNRVLVKEWKVRPVPLTGMQMKFGADVKQFTGTVRHIRSDHPTEPTTIHVWVEPDDNPEGLGKYCERCKVKEIEVDQRSIAGILK
jgi:hypothetical protein